MGSSRFLLTCTIFSFLSIWGAANLDCRLFLMIESKISGGMSILFDQESHTIPEWSGFQPPPRTEKKTSAAPTPSGKVASAFHQLGDLEVWLRNLEDMFIHFLVPASLRNMFQEKDQTARVSFHICFVWRQCAVMRHH